MAEVVFRRLYRSLNPAQREAVDAIDGPVMVVAGPGTGKTLVLTLRLANILRLTDTPPDAILALAFTKSAVHSMRERLVQIVGSAAYRVSINTFHGFCNDIIQRYPEEFPRIVGAKNVSGVEQVKILEQVIAGSKIKVLKPFGEPFYHLYDILAEIERLKKEDITAAEFKKLLVVRERAFKKLPGKYHRTGPHAGKLKGKFVELKKDLLKYRELAALYQDYEEVLRRSRLYDFSDMIMEVVRALKTESDFLLQLQETYLYILADEHQDANQSQNRLLQLLAGFHPSPNLFIVGDEKQAIFQFQGASLENFAYFRKLYPEAKLISLADNYRSQQTILDAAFSLFGRGERLRAVDKASGPPPKPIMIYPFTTTEDETRFIAEDLKNKIRNGVPPGELAVLYRDNQDGLALVLQLEQGAVPYVVESESNILHDPGVRKLVLLFKAIRYFGDDEWLAQAMLLDFLHLPPLEVYRLVEEARRRKTNLYSLISSPRSVFHRLYRNLERWHRLGANESLIQFFGEVTENSGLLASVLSRPDALTASSRLKAFYDEIKNLVLHHPEYRLKEFLEYLETLEKHGLVLREEVDPYRSGVRLMTVHKAKGLEFDYVYLINAYDGHFGGRRRRSTFKLPVRDPVLSVEDQLESERRLFYVALTRSRREVFITYAKEDREGRVRLPSQFIAEIPDGLKEAAETRSLEERWRRKKTAPRRRPGKTPLPLAEKSYLNNLFLARGLSVTDLNNYLKCPLRYFFLNLLRVVKVQTKSQFYGTAVHATLKDFFDRYRLNRRTSKTLLLRRFRYHLERQPLSAGDLVEIAAKGENSLSGYFDFYRNKWPRRIVNEFFVRGLPLTGEIKLKGRIDKIEFLDRGQEVRVVDYKTAKPKSRREVLGLTRSASGDLKRQLVFYKLLLDRGLGQKGEKFIVTSGEIDFVEPSSAGRYRKETLEISDGDVAELAELVKRAAGEIISLTFFRRGCGEQDCRWCRLYEMTGRGRLR